MFGPSGPTLTPARRARFEADRQILANQLPDVRHLILAGTSAAIAEGPVAVDAGAGRREHVHLRLSFGADYPPAPPDVRETKRRWRPHPDRHLFPDGAFCLGLPGVDAPELITPEDLAAFLDRLLVFLQDQLTFDVIGRWPGPDWPQGLQAAYAQYAIEVLRLSNAAELERLWPVVLGREPRPNRACPCGSRRAYAACHRSRVVRLRRVRSEAVFAELPAVITERLSAAQA
jgi:hypothetical protein